MLSGGSASATDPLDSTPAPFTESAEFTSARTRKRLAKPFPIRRSKRCELPAENPDGTKAVAPSSAETADNAYEADFPPMDPAPPPTPDTRRPLDGSMNRMASKQLSKLDIGIDDERRHENRSPR